MTEEKKSDELAAEKVADAVAEEKKEGKAEETVSDKEEKASDADHTGTCVDGACESGCCPMANGKSLLVWFVVAIVVVAGIAFYRMKGKDAQNEAKPLPEKKEQEVRSKANGIVNKLIAEGMEFEIGEIVEESELYKINVKVNDRDVASYLSKDMTKFFTDVIDVKALEETPKEEQEAAVTEVQKKTDKPMVELFVMSHCPYGTQIEKGILPVFKELGTTIDAKIKFVDYAMHGEKEVTEQLRQYCIQEKEPQKFHAYLDCFLKSEDATTCMRTAAVNQGILAQCASQTDKDYKVTELLKNKETWVSGQFPQFNISKVDNDKYGVQGSPTLVINGEVIQSGRDSASLLKAICSAFTTQPEACMKELSAVAPAPGFGDGAAAGQAGGAATDAGCGA